MEILQSKIYGKNDNFNLEEGKSYSDLKSSFIIKQVDDKFGKIYITDSLGYCIKIFDIELNKKIKDLSKNLEEYKTKITELFESQKESLKTYTDEKIIESNNTISTSLSGLNNSIENIKKKLPKKVIWEDSKIKIKLNDDNFLETEQINIVTENTKIKSFTYDAGVFKITDTNDTVFPSDVNLTQLFAPKIHNHDTEYVKINDTRLTNARVASDVHSWAKQPNKPTYTWSDILNKPELNFIPLSWNKRNNKEIIRTQVDDWLRINELGSHLNGVYFGTSIVRTDGSFQVGSDGNVFRTHKETNNDSIVIGNKIRIKTGQDDTHIGFGNPEWTKLVYGEFAGIKIWNNVDNNKVVLAGGGVIQRDQLTETAQYLRYALIGSGKLSKNISGRFRAGEFLNGQDAPLTGWFNYFGGRHSNVNNNFSYNFAIPFEGERGMYYFNNRTGGRESSWYKFIGFGALNNNGLFREWNLPHGLSTYIGDSGVYGVRTKFSGEGGDLILSADTTGIFGKGFKKENSSNDKVLLGGGGDINLSDLKNENIKIGGRNLIKDSNSFNVRSWNYKKGTHKGSTFVTPRGSQYENEATKLTFSGQEWDIFQKIHFDESGSYMLSGWVKLETANNLLVVVNNSYSATAIFGKAVITGAGWQKFSILLNVSGNLQQTFGHIHLGGYATLPTGETQSPGDVLLWNLKLEKGNKVTDWSPAPEDIEYKIDKIIKAGDVTVVTDWYYNLDYLGGTIIIESNCIVRLDYVPSGCSGSILKSGNNNNISFSCNGKQIVYTGDNVINGKDGSTATFTIYKNKCYIRISNV
jgi:hypothetical protein